MTEGSEEIGDIDIPPAEGMEGMDAGEGDGAAAACDPAWDEFISKNKLSKISEQLKSSGMNVSDFLQKSDEEVTEWAKSKSLDTLSRKRLIKSVASSRDETPKSGEAAPPVASPSPAIMSPAVGVASAVTVAAGAVLPPGGYGAVLGGLGPVKAYKSYCAVTAQEHESLTILYEKYVRTALLGQNLEGCSAVLKKTSDACKDVVNEQFDAIIAQIKQRKEELTSGVARMSEAKLLRIKGQETALNSYKRQLMEAEKTYQMLTKDPMMDVTTRKTRVLAMVDQIAAKSTPGASSSISSSAGGFDSEKIRLSMITQPQTRLAFESQNVNDFFETVCIDDCDQPPSPMINVTQVSFSSVTIDMSVEDEMLQNKAICFSVEYVLIKSHSKFAEKLLKAAEKARKKDAQKAAKRAKKGIKKSKKKKSKKKKKDDSDSDSDSDSDDSSDEKESDESDSDDSSEDSDSDSDGSSSEDSDDSDESKSDSDDDSDDSDESSYTKKKKAKKAKKKKAKRKSEELVAAPASEGSSKTTTTVVKKEVEDIEEFDDDDIKSDGAGSSKKRKSQKKKRESSVEASGKMGDLSGVSSNDLEFEEYGVFEIDPKYTDPGRHRSGRKYEYTLKRLIEHTDYAIRIRAKNKSGWGDYSGVEYFSTKKMTMDSKILKDKERSTLMKWIEKSMKGTPRIKLLFRASRDGYTGAAFHSKCDSKGTTIVVINSTNGNVFGGFTKVPWTSSGSYQMDTKSWIFLIRSKNKKKTGQWKVTNPSNATYHNSSYGPAFGGGYDFYLANGCGSNSSSYSNAGTSYGCPKDQTLLAGSYNFQVKDYEVFQIK